MRKIVILLSLGVLASCSTPPQDPNKTEIEQYMKSVSAKIEPIWKQEVKARVQNLATRGLKPIALPSPKNEILLSVEIAPNGDVKEVKPIRESKYAFLNKSAIKVLTDSSPLAKPPQSCIKENVCTLSWRFVVAP